ncbi:MAG TPA: TetR/AcrR family transcriptional regulator [Alphaproteobacteria bacterium]|nr:TetR/AcrR family transcriptional regulator [Alphaproteobacteria bacterium]
MQEQAQEYYDDMEEKEFKSGRPRSESSRRAILEATRRLLTHNSVQKLSIEAIARKAGVGKTTIYRWWPNKSAVIMEAVFSQPAFHNILPTPRNAVEGVRTLIDKLTRQLGGKNGRLVAEIVGEAQPDPETLKIFISTFLQDRYNSLSSYIEGGKQTGEFDQDIDTDSAIDVILGPIFFRLISGQELDDAFVSDMTEMLLKALRAE